MRRYLVCVLWWCLGTLTLSAQEKFTLSGTVKDKASGEELIGATVRIISPLNTGARTNEYGFYSISLPNGKYVIRVQYLGYIEKEENVDLSANKTLNWALESKSGTLKEVKVSSKKQNENITESTMGLTKLTLNEVAKLPVLFGEKDILKTIQLLPGVKGAGEGNSGYFVRGGSADQNLILLDEAPVYNASHLLGFFSTFNSDAIKDVTLLKGNAPAQYGGRLASVLDVKMNEGNDKQYHVQGGLGLISSRLSVEGPIQNEKSSFLIAGRRTYADVFLGLSDQFKDNKLYFYDLNAKANYRINKNNRIYLSGYFGRDVLGLGSQFGIDWGNRTGTLRWNSIVSPKLFVNTSLIYSDYDYKISIQGGGVKFNIRSEIQDYNLKQEWQYFRNADNTWRFGVNMIHHTLTPSRFEGDNDIFNDPNNTPRSSLENALYATNNRQVSKKISVEYGLRVSFYTLLGGDTYNLYDKGKLMDSVVLAKGSLGKTYINPEPRVSMVYRINENSSVKAAYARNTQHLHLLSNSVTTSPTDAWIGDSYNIKPEIADQLCAGYYRNFENNKYEFNVETYYKQMQNQVDYKNGADLQTAVDIESELLFGKGRAYGLELLLKKKQGRLTGWISYTLSRTERKIDLINNNQWYAAKQDRTHDLALVAMYPLNDQWSVAGNFVLYTGNAVTFPSGKYNVNGQTVYYYTERNGYRMPVYHRMDFSITREGKKSAKWKSSWNFSLYNVYGRENAYTISFEEDPDDSSKTRIVKTALFKWVPSITYNFKF